MGLLEIFLGKGKHLFWQRLATDRVHPVRTDGTFEPNTAYLVVRLKEMYLARTRVLWRKFYPLLHGYTSWGEDEHAVTGPGQLQELGDAGLDRIVNLNHRLAGPLPYRGQDISVTVGLYAVPGQDAAKALIATVGELASLGGLALGTAKQLADTVKQGVESILGLSGTSLQLGIRDSFYASGNPPRPGYYLGIAASPGEVDVGSLWLSSGRLVAGTDPLVGQPYSRHDYMVLELERRERRDDWPGMPGLAEFEAQFAGVMRDGSLTVDQQRERLGGIWPGFGQALRDSPYLIQKDRERIALDVEQDLKGRLAAREQGNPFETRELSGKEAQRKEPEDYDFLDVADYLDPDDPASRQRGFAALSGNPFGR